MFGRIYLKLYLSFLLIFLVTMIIVVMLASHHFSRNVRNELEDIFLSHAQFLAEQYRTDCGNLNSISTDSCRNFFRNFEKLEGLRLWVVDPQGKIIMTQEDRDLRIDADDIKNAEENEGIIMPRFRRPARVIVDVPDLPEKRYLVIEPSFRGHHRHFPRFPLIYSLIIVGIVAALLVLPLSHRITRRITELHQLAQDWAEGRLDRRAQVHGKDEIAQLATVFNSMAENLQKSLQQRKEYLALISHELKSPLARMRIALELLADKNETKPDVLEIIQGIKSEISESEQLIEQLLVLSRIEMALPSAIREAFDLNAVIKRAIDQVMPMAQVAVVDIVSELSSVPQVHGDASQIQRAIANVLENAVKYSPPESAILVKTKSDQKMVEISIADSGPGIPEQEREKIFEPFYRGTQPEQKEGAGLGLFIACRIIELHNGKIRALPNDPNGTILQITLNLE
ncbi:HAMP domain-containing histidine kinase [bacterium]|nr:HAMP domain-containing histidine kinase [bacterium]MCI0613194.1 HAMP domain-containing histidine kinase [bacterium]